MGFTCLQYSLSPSASKPLIRVNQVNPELAPAKELQQAQLQKFSFKLGKNPSPVLRQASAPRSREPASSCATREQVSLKTRSLVIACSAGQGTKRLSETQAIFGCCIHHS